jgi:hypothetical protein
MIFGSLFRQRKRAAVDDETQSETTSAQYWNIHPYGRYVVSAYSTNTASVIPSQASPTSFETLRTRSSTQANARTLEFSNLSEGGCRSYVIWEQPSPFGKIGLQTGGDVPNLTGQVTFATSRPIFEGTYSNVYRGTYKGQEV